jgi:hypothetical protein
MFVKTGAASAGETAGVAIVNASSASESAKRLIIIDFLYLFSICPTILF